MPDIPTPSVIPTEQVIERKTIRNTPYIRMSRIFWAYLIVSVLAFLIVNPNFRPPAWFFLLGLVVGGFYVIFHILLWKEKKQQEAKSIYDHADTLAEYVYEYSHHKTRLDSTDENVVGQPFGIGSFLTSFYIIGFFKEKRTYLWDAIIQKPLGVNYTDVATFFKQLARRELQKGLASEEAIREEIARRFRKIGEEVEVGPTTIVGI